MNGDMQSWVANSSSESWIVLFYDDFSIHVLTESIHETIGHSEIYVSELFPDLSSSIDSAYN